MVRSIAVEGPARARAPWGAIDGSCATAPAYESPLAEVIPLPIGFEPASPAVPGAGSARPRVVLTRRGRLVRTFVATFMLALLALMVAARVAEPAPVETARTSVVGSDQTLVDVAAHELPGMPVGDAVMAIRVFNDMSGSSVEPGQRLLIPRL